MHSRVQLRVVMVRILFGRLLLVLLRVLVVVTAEMLVPEVAAVLVPMTVDARVLVVVLRLARVFVPVRHLAAVLVVVHHLARMDQRYAFAGQLVRVHVVHVLRYFLGHHNDDPVVSARNNGPS